MKNYRETLKDTFTEIDGLTFKVKKGAEIKYVLNAGDASGFVLSHEALQELSDDNQDSCYVIAPWGRYEYRYVPQDAVFEAIYMRDPIAEKSENWQDTAHKWQIRINSQSFEYYTGIGNKTAPDYDSFLESILSDSEALDMTFEDFCDEFGYDSDSRKAFKVWESCCNNARKLLKTGIDLEAEKIRIQNL